MLIRLLLATSLVVSLPAVGSAAFLTFTDRAAWQAVAGNPTATEDFEAFTQNTFIFPTPVQANGFSLAATGFVPPIFGNRVQVLPFPPPFAAQLSPNGSNFFFGALINDPDQIFIEPNSGGKVNVTFTFDSAVSAFGVDLRSASNSFIDVYGAGNMLLGTISPTTNDAQFYGFALTGELAERLEFRNTASTQDGAISVNTFGVDNVALVAIPEPSSVMLIVLGLPGLALLQRLRRAGGATAVA